MALNNNIRNTMLAQLAETTNPELNNFGAIHIPKDGRAADVDTVNNAMFKFAEYNNAEINEKKRPEADRVSDYSKDWSKIDNYLTEKFVASYNVEHGTHISATDEKSVMKAVDTVKADRNDLEGLAAGANHLLVVKQERVAGVDYQDQSKEISNMNRTQLHALVAEGQKAINSEARAANAHLPPLREDGVADATTRQVLEASSRGELNDINAPGHKHELADLLIPKDAAPTPQGNKGADVQLAKKGNAPGVETAKKEPAHAPVHDTDVASFVRKFEQTGKNADGSALHQDKRTALAGHEVVAALKASGAVDVSKLEANLARKGAHGVVDDKVMQNFIKENGGNEAVLAKLENPRMSAPGSVNGISPEIAELLKSAPMPKVVMADEQATDKSPSTIEQIKAAMKGITSGGETAQIATVPNTGSVPIAQAGQVR